MIPGLGLSAGGGHGNPLQCSCLEDPRDRGAWQGAVPGVTQSRTRVNDLPSLSLTHSCRKVRREAAFGARSRAGSVHLRALSPPGGASSSPPSLQARRAPLQPRGFSTPLPRVPLLPRPRDLVVLMPSVALVVTVIPRLLSCVGLSQPRAVNTSWLLRHGRLGL